MFKCVRNLSSVVAGALFIVGCGGGSDATAPLPPSPNPPPSASPNSAPSISGEPANYVFIDDIYAFQPVIQDAENDRITISSENLPDWLSIDLDTAEIQGMPVQNDVGVWPDITVVASDGMDETRFVFSVEVRRDDVEKALATGEYDQVRSLSVYYAAIREELQAGLQRFEAPVFDLFGLDADGIETAYSLTDLHWRMSSEAHLLVPVFGNNIGLLYPDTGTPNEPDSVFALYGQKQEARYLVLGGNPIHDGAVESADVNEQMLDWLRNSISVLSQIEDPSLEPISVIVAHFDDSGSLSERTAVHDWLNGNYAGALAVNEQGDCDGAALRQCLQQDIDLIILSGHLSPQHSADTLDVAIRQAVAQGTPILFMAKAGAAQDGNYVGFNALEAIPVGLAGDRRNRLNSFDVTKAVIGQLPPSLSRLSEIFGQLETGLLDYNLLECNERSCPRGHGYRDDFQPLLDSLVERFGRYDVHGYDLFDGNTQTFRLDKLLALWADSVRSDVAFPMVASGFGNQAFLTSALADSIVPYRRFQVSPQQDRGTFGSQTYDGVETRAIAKTIRAQLPFRSSGTYALPGRTIKVSRTDARNDVQVEIRINSSRSSSVRLFGNSGVSRDQSKEHYNRPLHVASTKVPLQPGETIYLTSPYGGPIHIYADQKDVDIGLEFQNVGAHPYWDGEMDGAAFITALSEDRYDWAEISLPQFELHAPLARMRQTLESSVWQPDFDGDELSALVEGTEDTVDWLNALAGYSGAGVSSVPEVSRFAERHGLDIQPLPQIQHVYVDQATCSTACGGNPYELDRAYYPYNMTAIHEHGHSLEVRDHRFDGWGVHSQTDLYLHYHQYRQILKHGADWAISTGRSLPYEAVFNTLQASRRSSDPFNYMRDEGPSTWQERQVVMMQILSIAENESVFDRGWYALSAFHLVEREYANIESEAEWIAKSAGLGFGGLAFDDVQRWSNNDWNLAVWSHILERDLTNYFEMWGLSFSDEAKAFVASQGDPAQPLVFYAHSGSSHKLGLSVEAIVIDGVSDWSGKVLPSMSKADFHLECDHEH